MRKFVHRAIAHCLLLAFFFVLCRSVAQGQQSSALVIEGGTLIDGNGGTPVRDALIVIRQNKIDVVSRKGQVSYPAGAQVLRADGKFIVPGLWDAHAHYQWWMPELFLSFGVTSTSLTQGSNWARATREAIERGKIPGPRLFLHSGSGTVGAGANVLENAEELVRRGIATKPADINLMRGISFEVYKAVIEEAHKAGFPVVAQPVGPDVYGKEAVLAGVDILEHAAGVGRSLVKDPSKWKGFGAIEVHSMDPTPYSDMDEAKARELIALMVKQKVFLEPDLIAVGRGFQKRRQEYEWQDYRIVKDFRLSYIPEDRRMKELRTYREFDVLEPADRERRNQGYQNEVRFLKRFVDAGGRLLTGTDTSSWAVPGIGLHHEFDILVSEVGLTPMQVIVAATRNPAEAWRVLDRQGTIEPGKLADVVIVNQDPLQDIRNLQKIEWVIKDGKLVDRTFHPWFDPPLKNYYFGASEEIVEGRDVVAALKRRAEEGIRLGGTGDIGPAWSFGLPTPAIESLSPNMVTEGDPTVTLTIKGVNFTVSSVVYLDSYPIPTQMVSETELRATITPELMSRPATFAIIVKNLGDFWQQPQWGGATSNRAHLLVNYRY